MLLLAVGKGHVLSLPPQSDLAAELMQGLIHGPTIDRERHRLCRENRKGSAVSCVNWETVDLE